MTKQGRLEGKEVGDGGKSVKKSPSRRCCHRGQDDEVENLKPRFAPRELKGDLLGRR